MRKPKRLFSGIPRVKFDGIKCFDKVFGDSALNLWLVYRIPGSKTKNIVYSSFLSLTVEKTIYYHYLLSLVFPIIPFFEGFLVIARNPPHEF